MPLVLTASQACVLYLTVEEQLLFPFTVQALMQEILLFLGRLFATILLAIGANAAISTAPSDPSLIR